MQENAFRESGIEARYLLLPLDLAGLRAVLTRKRNLLLKGFNVTIPFKETVSRYLEDVSEEARLVGAVNTVFVRNGRWAGTNTDVFGFMQSLGRDASMSPRGKNAVVLGAGGAARAAVYSLCKAGISSAAIFNRSEARARRLTEEFGNLFPDARLTAHALRDPFLTEAVKKAALVVNATSMGLKASDPMPLPAESIPRAAGKGRGKLFYDLIYAPAETPFLREARRKGHRVLNGVGMLVYQGAKAFECWTNRRAPVKIMRAALLEALKNRESGMKV